MNEPPRIGEPAPELAARTLQGDDFSLRARRGSPVVVSFLRHAG